MMYKILFTLLITIPLVTTAAGVSDLITASYTLVNEILIPLAFALALLYFFWGIAQYIRAGAGGEKVAQEGRKVMLYGVIAMFVAVSIWGIVNFIRTNLDLPDIQKVNKGTTR